MKINYLDILNKNMINVFIEVLKNIKKNGLKEGHHLYITFRTNEKKVNIPIWLKNKFPKEMTIVIQYEYWNLLINKSDFKITLSFNDIKSDLTIPFKSVISFADPYANFGLKLINDDKKSSVRKNKIKYNKNNIINFNEFKKNK